MISIDEARKALSDGKIIVYPTDTVWGMGCDPFDQKAIDNLFTVKGKKLDGLSIMFSHKKGIYDSCEINKKAKKIIEEFLPGPITLILKSKKEFAKGVTRNGNVAVRIPLNRTSMDLAKDMPVVTTSANLHGEKIAEDIEEAKEIFGKSCYYLDGEKPKGIESTIIDLTKNEPKIARIGALYSTILEGMFES
ncbi:MAG: threonylcarbamoyl-AMP synthase [Candidatus Poseidoniia archaeon]|nr:threonylcarbamoyl-AMP synthase [Candidatus Poseidoniia archaeon]